MKDEVNQEKLNELICKLMNFVGKSHYGFDDILREILYKQNDSIDDCYFTERREFYRTLSQLEEFREKCEGTWRDIKSVKESFKVFEKRFMRQRQANIKLLRSELINSYFYDNKNSIFYLNFCYSEYILDELIAKKLNKLGCLEKISGERKDNSVKKDIVKNLLSDYNGYRYSLKDKIKRFEKICDKIEDFDELNFDSKRLVSFIKILKLFRNKFMFHQNNYEVLKRANISKEYNLKLHEIFSSKIGYIIEEIKKLKKNLDERLEEDADQLIINLKKVKVSVDAHVKEEKAKDKSDTDLFGGAYYEIAYKSAADFSSAIHYIMNAWDKT